MSRSHGIPLLASLFSLVLVVGPEASAGQSSQDDPSAEAAPAPIDLVVLPFVNYTGRHEAFVEIPAALYERLDETELTYVSDADVRPLLREERIRAAGAIGRDDAQRLAAKTGARLALLGSLDLYNPETSMEVAVSARILDLATMQVLGAVSVGLTVQETESWFRIGRAEDIASVMHRVVDELVDALEPWLVVPPAPRVAYHRCGLVATVPLDDYSDSRYAAQVVHNLLLAELVRDGWFVVEPGFVQEILLDEQIVARGGVTDDVLDILRERLGVCWVLTGEVETFSVTSSAEEAAVPLLGFGLRLIDARAPRLVSTFDVARDGSHGETFFGRGRDYSMARLIRSCLGDVTDWLRREGDK